MEELPRTFPAVASEGSTSNENLRLSVKRVKNKNAFFAPSSPKIPVDLTVGLKSDPLG